LAASGVKAGMEVELQSTVNQREDAAAKRRVGAQELGVYHLVFVDVGYPTRRSPLCVERLRWEEAEVSWLEERCGCWCPALCPYMKGLVVGGVSSRVESGTSSVQ
jgi:hypothetical protein